MANGERSFDETRAVALAFIAYSSLSDGEMVEEEKKKILEILDELPFDVNLMDLEEKFNQMLAYWQALDEDDRVESLHDVFGLIGESFGPVFKQRFLLDLIRIAKADKTVTEVEHGLIINYAKAWGLNLTNGDFV